MRVFVTGCSGKLGRAVASRLLSDGHRVIALQHGCAYRPGDRDERLEYVWGAMSQASERVAAIGRIDAVVHCAWDSRTQIVPPEEDPNLVTTLPLMRAAARAGATTFVHVSSVSVYGLSRSLWGTEVCESHPLRALDEAYRYPKVKVLLEQALARVSQDTQPMALVVVRPGLLFDDDHAPLKRVIGVGPLRLGILLGLGRNHLPYVHVDDVARLISRILVAPAGDRVYNVAPRLRPSALRMGRAWLHKHGGPVLIVRIPTHVFRAAYACFAFLKSMLGRRSGSIDYQILTGIRDIRYDSSRAARELGWTDAATATVMS